MTEPSVTYAYAGEHFDVPKSCAGCHYWDNQDIADGFATCYQLICSIADCRLDVLDKLPEGGIHIIRTHANFRCKYWTPRK